MKKFLSITIIIILLVAGVFLLTGCGDNSNNGEGSKTSSEKSDNKTFPVADFIPSGIEYTGSGKIVGVTKNESSDPKVANVYYQNAKIEEVVSYVNSLKSKGLTKANSYAKDQTEFDEYGSYSWVGVNSDNTFSISITMTEEESEELDYNYNLSINMSDDNPYGE